MTGKCRPVVGSAVAFAAVVVLLFVAGQAPGANPRPAVFFDAIGDSGTAPDVTSVAVVNDDTGRITFQINFATRPAVKHFVLIGIDADRNANSGTSGRPRGVDYLITAASNGYQVSRATATGWEHTDIEAAYQSWNRGLQLTIAGSDIHLGHSFRFSVRTVGGQDRNAVDDVPASGRLLTYTLGPAAQLGEIEKFSIGPLTALTPKAGALLRPGSVVFIVPGGQSGLVQSAAAPDRVRCSARIGSAVLPPAGRSCVFRVPEDARGKELVLTIAIAYRGDEVTDVFPMKVE